MVKRRTLTTVQQISEINLTPLMDLTFILLITFIITFPLIEQGISVNLPEGDAEAVEPDKSRTISLDLTGELYLDDVPITIDELSNTLIRMSEARSDAALLVRADEGIEYGKLIEVLNVINKAKITQVGLVTQAERN